MKSRTIILFLCCAPFITQAQQRLTIKIEGIEKIQGQLKVGFYTEKEEFAGETPLVGKIIKVNSKTAICVLDSIKDGQYAISIYHDLNSNGKLDKNWFGIPSEKYGFSNNPKVRKTPTFEQCRFDFTKKKDLVIKLQ
ncbi:MAG: DUF2141 domain-containing protein [Prevotellaceae bacterium]|jgi:uncharacterized protein (DUF2141 family)|nr:DUF2141 domain-containing protein [Prevotellaceae bacterium]